MTNEHHISVSAPIIELRDICKTYHEGVNERRVLENVNFSIYPGELTILLGKSGSGKSTLLNLISGIDVANYGEVFIENRNMTRFTEYERTVFRRRHIGFIFQFFNLIPTLTVEENLKLPLELNGKTGKKADHRVADMLEKVGLRGRESSYPDRLSGGEQQRIAIARALVHDPTILLADEPTGNLDADTGQQVIGLLDQLVREQRKTLIMATHSKEVIGLADRILSIRDGRLLDISGNSI
ncbi:MAG: ABC transporter ATP-binding protein [Candidatus Zhuqueibacterota bacterium]